MPSHDPRIDSYIAKSPAFAQPILEHVRDVIHAACPEVEETMKWSAPHFDYQGIMCAMVVFKAHMKVGFWKGALVLPPAKRANENNDLRRLGHLTSMAELPSDRILTGYVKAAMKLNEAGVQAPHVAARTARPPAKAPGYFMTAVRANSKALATWNTFSPSMQREYIEWVTDAKTQPTRERRLATTVEQLAEGKSRNWKYESRT